MKSFVYLIIASAFILTACVDDEPCPENSIIESGTFTASANNLASGELFDSQDSAHSLVVNAENSVATLTYTQKDGVEVVIEYAISNPVALQD